MNPLRRPRSRWLQRGIGYARGDSNPQIRNLVLSAADASDRAFETGTQGDSPLTKPVPLQVNACPVRRLSPWASCPIR